MDFVRKLFKFIVLGFLGLVGLGIVMSIVLSPSDEDMAKQREEERAQKQQEEKAIKERVTAKLKSELQSNRAGVIQEVRELMVKKEYLQAYRRANRFSQFNDEEMGQLAKTAQQLHQEAEAIKKAQEERRMAAALKKMNKRIDKIEGTEWYKDKFSPVYNNQNGFYIYIGKAGASDPWLRLRIQYYADDWLFIESFIVVADGQRFERNAVNFEQDHDSMIWEWYDETVSEPDLAMIRAVIDSKEAVIRFNGRQYRSDKKITPAQKVALQNVLDAYKALGGK